MSNIIFFKLYQYYLVQVFCNDCDELIKTVLSERSMNPGESDVHCGFDSGQGMLKIQ